MIRLTACLLALTCAATAVAGELYRWTDEKGGVHYSDQPPPVGNKTGKRVGSSNAAPAATPATETAAKPAQIVLYSANCGNTCDQAVDFLRQRGVQFSLKAIDKDPQAALELSKRTGATSVPVLMVGTDVQRGFAAPVWDKMLEVAGYPAAAAKPRP